MKKTIAFIIAIVFSSITYAAPPTTESLDEFFAVSRAQKMIDAVYEMANKSMANMIKAKTHTQQMSEQQRKILDAYAEKSSEVMRDELSWANMRPLMIQIYQESFSQEEINGLIAFYKSPTGVAFVEKMPIVMQKSQTIMGARMGKIMSRLNASLQEATDQVKASK